FHKRVQRAPGLPPGSLDTTFGGTGKVTTDFAGGSDYAAALVLQPDGKLVAAGQAQANPQNTDSNFGLARYNTNGSLDTTFGGTGKITTDFSSQYDQGAALVLQPDGKIAVAGSAEVGNNSALAVARYNADGSLDTTFGGTGKVTTVFPNTNNSVA